MTINCKCGASYTDDAPGKMWASNANDEHRMILKHLRACSYCSGDCCVECLRNCEANGSKEPLCPKCQIAAPDGGFWCPEHAAEEMVAA